MTNAEIETQTMFLPKVDRRLLMHFLLDKIQKYIASKKVELNQQLCQVYQHDLQTCGVILVSAEVSQSYLWCILNFAYLNLTSS